jgi:hypothetical protein
MDILQKINANADLLLDMRDEALKMLEGTDEQGNPTGKVFLGPRANEIEVVYETPLDFHPDEKRRRRRRYRKTLQHLLDRLEAGDPKVTNIEKIEHVSVKSYDPRRFALRTIEATKDLLDQLARIHGIYKKDAENPNDVHIKAAETLAFLKWAHGFANSPETKAAHARGEDIPFEAMLGEVNEFVANDDDARVLTEVQKQLEARNP